MHFIDNLPQRLTDEEEIHVISRLAQGDSAARNVLIERNLRLVIYIARKFENTGIGIEDLTSIGTIGLIKAVNTFNPTKKIKLATYASRCVENEILMYLRRNSKTRCEVSLEEPLNIDWDGNELLLEDVMGVDDPGIQAFERTMLFEAVFEVMSTFRAREQKILELRYLSERVYTQREVANILGISQSYISRIEKKLLKRIRNQTLRFA